MEMVHDFDEYVERRGTDAKKYNQYGPDVIPMWIADTDFKCPQPVVDAVVARMQEGVYGYTFNSERLKKAGARWQKVRFGWDVDPSWVEYSPGVIGGVICAVRALSQPGDNIVIQTPCYPPFKDLSDHNGRHLPGVHRYSHDQIRQGQEKRRCKSLTGLQQSEYHTDHIVRHSECSEPIEHSVFFFCR